MKGRRGEVEKGEGRLKGRKIERKKEDWKEVA